MGLSVILRKSLQWEKDRHSPALTAPELGLAAQADPAPAISAKPLYRFLGRSRRLGA